MHAVVITEPGEPDVLSWLEVPDPAPGPGEVVIDIAAGGDVDDHLTGAGRRVGHLEPAQHVGFAGFGDDDGVHSVSFARWSARCLLTGGPGLPTLPSPGRLLEPETAD